MSQRSMGQAAEQVMVIAEKGAHRRVTLVSRPDDRVAIRRDQFGLKSYVR